MPAVRDTLSKEVSRLRRFAYSLTGDIADADDLVHDVVVKVLDSGLPERGDPVPWLVTLTKNLWIDRLRHNKVREKNGTVDSTDELEGQAAEEIISQLHAQELMDNLAALPEAYRLVLSLVAIEGMSYAETARMLDIPIGTVMSRLSRAREQMMKMSQSVEVVKCKTK